MQWVALMIAIGFEVAGTLSLRVAATGRPQWFGVVVVAYGIWAATGVAATAVLSRVLFKEPLTALMMAGIGLIAVGVLLVETGSH